MAKIDKVISIKVEGVRRIKELEDSLKKLRKEQRENKKQSEGDANRYSKTAKSIKEQSTELRGLRKQMAGVNETTKKGNRLQDSMFKGVVKGAAAFSILVTAFRRVNQAMVAMISSFTEFEFTMAKVRAVSGATNDEFKQLESSAAELGRTTFFTASQVAELQLNFSKLGFTTQEILDAQEATINLSIATGSDLARAATVAGSAIRGFGLDASEAARVVDVMAVAFTSSALDIEKFQTSMTKVAPIAAASGFTIEETTAIMSKLADTGIEASIAGTSLRNIFLKLQDPTSKLSRRFGNTAPNLEALLAGFQQMIDDGDDMADMMGVVDIRQVAAFQTMVKGKDDVAALAEELKNSAGAGQEMADIVGDTTQGAILKVKSAIEGFSIALVSNFGEAMKKTLVRFAEFLNGLVENEKKTKALIKSIKGFIKILAAYVIGTKVATIATKLFAGGLFGASTSVGVLGRALVVARAGLTAFKVALASTGIGLLVIALGELAAKFMFVNEETERASSITDDINSAMENQNKEAKKLEISLKSLKDVREQISKIEGEGEVQKRRISRLRKQEEQDIANINKVLKAENEELIDIRDTTEEITSATEDLITTLKNKALAGVYTKLYEQIVEDFVGADIVRAAVDEVYGFDSPDNMASVIADLRSDFVAANASAPSDIIRQEAKERAQQLLEEQNLSINQLERLVQEGALDKRLDDLKSAISERVGGIDILNELLSPKSGGSGGGNTGGVVGGDDAITPLQNFLNKEIKVVEESREKIQHLEREHNKKIIEARIKAFEDFLAQDITDGDERIRVEKQLAAERQKLAKENAKLELLAAEDGKREALEEIGMGTSDLERRFIELEAEKAFLAEKLEIHKLYGMEVGEIEKAIRENQIKTHELVREAYMQEIGEIAKIGDGIQELAGDNEKLNAVRLIGLKVTQAATLAESLLNLQKEISNYESKKAAMLNIQEMVTQQGKNAVTIQGIIASLGAAGANAAQGVTQQSKLIFPFNILAMASTIAAVIGVMASIRGLFGINPRAGAGATAGVSGGSSGGSSGGLGSGSTLYSFANTGSTFADGGMVYGNSHTNGGEKFAVGGRVVELEGGEAVINKRSTSMFRSQLSAMNAAGGGTKFADGGIANSPSFAQTQFDVMGQSMMSSGGRVTVVEADITSTQNSVKTIESEASF
jgi:TP901 family phage tail tape measure protein